MPQRSPAGRYRVQRRPQLYNGPTSMDEVFRRSKVNQRVVGGRGVLYVRQGGRSPPAVLFVPGSFRADLGYFGLTCGEPML